MTDFKNADLLGMAESGGPNVIVRSGDTYSINLDGLHFDDPVTIWGGRADKLRITNCSNIVIDGLRMAYTPKPTDRINEFPFSIHNSSNIVLQNVMATGGKNSGVLPNGQAVTDMWSGQALYFNGCNCVGVYNSDFTNFWLGPQFADCHDFVFYGNRVSGMADDALRLIGSTGGDVSGNVLLPPDPPLGLENPMHADQIHCFAHWDTGKPCRGILFESNWIQSAPKFSDKYSPNTIYVQGSKKFPENHGIVFSNNVIAAGGNIAIAIEHPHNCWINSNTILKTGDDVPKIQLRRAGSGNSISGNIMPHVTYIPPEVGTESRNNLITDTMDDIVKHGPNVDTWRAKNGGAYDDWGDAGSSLLNGPLDMPADDDQVIPMPDDADELRKQVAALTVENQAMRDTLMDMRDKINALLA